MPISISKSDYEKNLLGDDNILPKRKTNFVRNLETLDTLENDPEYVKTAERFLKGISEGGTVDDLC